MQAIQQENKHRVPQALPYDRKNKTILKKLEL